MPASRHRRHGKRRPRDRNQGSAGRRISPEFAAELTLLHDFLRARHGDHPPTNAEIADALTALSAQLPVSHRLLRALEDDADGELARVLMALAQG